MCPLSPVAFIMGRSELAAIACYFCCVIGEVCVAASLPMSHYIVLLPPCQ